MQRKRLCAENSSCSLVLELMLEPKASATWLCTVAAQGAHSSALLSVTQADLTQAMLTISSHHNSSSSSGSGSGSRGSKYNREKVRATVSFGHRAAATSLSPFLLLSPLSSAQNFSSCSRQTVFVKLDGPTAAAVDDVAQVRLAADEMMDRFSFHIPSRVSCGSWRMRPRPCAGAWSLNT